MKKGMITIDIKKCLGCKSCEIACAVAHSDLKELKAAISEGSVNRITVEQVDASPFKFSLKPASPLQCRHCDDAPCVKICPSKSLEKIEDEGPVIFKDESCIGCKWCVIVCPFGVIKTARKKTGGLTKEVMIKCDLCVERLKKDEMPACVSACPTKAIKFESIETITKDKRKKYLAEIVGSMEK